jgi:sugar lactone lactonase YvrE
LDIPISGGNATPLAEGHRPQGVATDAAGKVHITGRDPQTGLPGVFVLDGGTARAIVTGGDLRSPSGLDIADDGTIYVADSTAAGDLGDELVSGAGRAAVFEIKGTNTRVVAAGIEGGYPTGIAIAKNGNLVISAYVDRGSHSAVVILDLKKPKEPTIYTKKLETTFASAGLHRSRQNGTMTWSGGDTVYVIKQ